MSASLTWDAGLIRTVVPVLLGPFRVMAPGRLRERLTPRFRRAIPSLVVSIASLIIGVPALVAATRTSPWNKARLKIGPRQENIAVV